MEQLRFDQAQARLFVERRHDQLAIYLNTQRQQRARRALGRRRPQVNGRAREVHLERRLLVVRSENGTQQRLAQHFLVPPREVRSHRHVLGLLQD